jgi:hypothetical protein
MPMLETKGKKRNLHNALMCQKSRSRCSRVASPIDAR